MNTTALVYQFSYRNVKNLRRLNLADLSVQRSTTQYNNYYNSVLSFCNSYVKISKNKKM